MILSACILYRIEILGRESEEKRKFDGTLYKEKRMCRKERGKKRN
jgi:hypothetical protein